MISKRDSKEWKRFIRNLRLAKRRIHYSVLWQKIKHSLRATSKNITVLCHFSFEGFRKSQKCTWKNMGNYYESNEGNVNINIPSILGGGGYLYIRFYGSFPEFIYLSNGSEHIKYNCKYLHTLIDLSCFEKKAKKLTIEFCEKVCLSQIYIFTSGLLPKWVQKWDDPCEQCDVLFMTTHSDDEHLFFSGVLPLSVAKGKRVQVSYYVPPLAEYRKDELLDGLWHIGITNYPVFGDFYEEYSESVELAIENLKAHGQEEADIHKYIIGTIRRFKPNVIMAQDINGEYGHGQHRLFAQELLDVIGMTGDKDIDVDSAIQYGVHVVPKVYHHLFDRNKVRIDIDTPMEELDGRSPFRVSQEGFSFHRSQYVSFFPRQLFGTIRHPIKYAKQIEKYAPTEWGCSYSTTESALYDDFICE